MMVADVVFKGFAERNVVEFFGVGSIEPSSG